MKFLKRRITPLVALCINLSLFAQEPPFENEYAEKIDILKLEGKSFEGRIRAKGIIGLFSVKGTLSFKEGLLIWSTNDSEDSAPYDIEEMDGVWKFTSHVLEEGGTYVDWSGTYDGETIKNVKATWTRTEENDFIHDIFLPDVVTFAFKEEND